MNAIIESDGRSLHLGAGQTVEFALLIAADKFGKCSDNPPRLIKRGDPPSYFGASLKELPPGTYIYNAQERYYYDARFGHLVTPSSQDFNLTREIQNDPKLRNLNFRPAEAAPFLPLQLVHPVFATFLDDIRTGDLHPTKQDYDFFSKLAVIASRMLDEPEFKAEVNDACNEYFETLKVEEEMFTGILKDRDSRGTATDLGMRICQAIMLLCEAKRGISGTKTDPQMQGIGNYKLDWTKRRAGTADSFADTPYPAFLMEIVGQSLKIGGLVTLGGQPDDTANEGGKVWYQPLASVDLYAINRHDLTMAEQGVKVFMALKKALLTLKDYWLGLTEASPAPDRNLEMLIHSKKLPHMLLGYGDKVEQIGNRLVYVVRGGLSGKLTGDYVVKYVQAYGRQVHDAWAREGLAPKLHAVFYAGGGWTGLAMEYLKEEDGWKCLGQLDARVADGFRQQVLKFLDKAHRVVVQSSKDRTPGYGVHGDMRDANVMVLLDTEGNLQDVKFIDFDWAKVQGDDKGFYPGFINTGINWHEDVQAGGQMLQEHDKALLKRPRGEQLKDWTPPKSTVKRAKLTRFSRLDTLLPDDVC